ncbi:MULTISPECIES: hypothetical protein [unclassified Roseivivax]|uniref:hypothetical protein n=1 Tax=Roseivivax sp. GX 12232 TaxID=2900547 RepID=UPI001E5F4599|nr:hypothetical protein [Roseivivax sp. GX 12232]MCE0504419.1 hypothetical protein [Roseivivax sp. GX 12232]
MFSHLKTFSRSECGAITVDWVVLTAGTIALAIAAYTLMGGQTLDLVNDTSNTIDAEEDVVLTGAGD